MVRPIVYFCVSSKFPDTFCLAWTVFLCMPRTYPLATVFLLNQDGCNLWRAPTRVDTSSERHRPLSVVLIDIEHSPSCTNPDRLLLAGQTNKWAGGCRLSSADHDSHQCFYNQIFRRSVLLFLSQLPLMWLFLFSVCRPSISQAALQILFVWREQCFCVYWGHTPSQKLFG